MHQWRKTRLRLVITLLICFTQIFTPFLASSSQYDGYEPPAGSDICGMELDGDNKWTSRGETETCNKGSIYDPFKAYKNNNVSAGYEGEVATCPIDRVMCDENSIYYCPFNDSECIGTTCQQNKDCDSVSWTETVRKVSVPVRSDNKIEVTTPCEQIAGGNYRCPNGSGIRYLYEGQCHLNERECADFVRFNSHSNVMGYWCQADYTYYDSRSEANENCQIVTWEEETVNGYDCPLTNHNDKYTNANTCEANCIETANCSQQKKFDCPLGDEYACVNLDINNNTDNFACSDVYCGDYLANMVDIELDEGRAVNDGEFSDEGQCLDGIEIFTGKAHDCRLAGMKSLYKNCCHDADGEIRHDSMGSVNEMVAYTKTAQGTYQAVMAAYAAYEAGAAAAEAAQAGYSAFIGAFDPYSLAIMAIIAIITNLIEKSCPPEGAETAILDASGMCIFLGVTCEKRLFGNCVQEREVMCCYDSLMSKLINEQGKPQLGLGFGTVDEPNCEGFTQIQFQSLDFSKIDLSTYYDEIRHKQQDLIEEDMTNELQDDINRLTD